MVPEQCFAHRRCLATSAGVSGYVAVNWEYIETWLAWILSNALYNLLFFSQSYSYGHILPSVYCYIGTRGYKVVATNEANRRSPIYSRYNTAPKWWW